MKMSFVFEFFLSLAHGPVLPKNALLLVFCLSSPGIVSQERVCDTEGEVEHFSSTRGSAFPPQNTVKTDKTMSFFDIFPLAHSLVLPKNALLLLLVLFCL